MSADEQTASERWHVEEEPYGFAIIDENRLLIAEVPCSPETREERRPDAELLALSPEMRDALATVVEGDAKRIPVALALFTGIDTATLIDMLADESTREGIKMLADNARFRTEMRQIAQRGAGRAGGGAISLTPPPATDPAED